MLGGGDHGGDRLARVVGDSVAVREGWLVEQGGARCWRTSAPTPSTSRVLGVAQARKTGSLPPWRVGGGSCTHWLRRFAAREPSSNLALGFVYRTSGGLHAVVFALPRRSW